MSLNFISIAERVEQEVKMILIRKCQATISLLNEKRPAFTIFHGKAQPSIFIHVSFSDTGTSLRKCFHLGDMTELDHFNSKS